MTQSTNTVISKEHVYLSRSSFSGSSSGSDSCADTEMLEGHHKTLTRKKERKKEREEELWTLMKVGTQIGQQERREVRMKGTDIFTKITVEFVTSILLFHVVVIVVLLRGNKQHEKTHQERLSAARCSSTMYVNGRSKSHNCINHYSEMRRNPN